MSSGARRPPPRSGQEEKHRRSRPALWPLLALMLCLGGLGAVGSGVLRVQRVDVVGANLPSDAIVQTAGVVGQNIFTVRADAVVARLANDHEIYVLRVDTLLPNRVTIYVRARPHMVAWRNGPALYELDPSGRIVDQVARTTLPVIVGGVAAAPPGQGIVQAVHYGSAALPAVPNGAIATFRLTRDRGLVVVGRSGWQATLGRGTPQTLVNRIATLKEFLVKTQGKAGHLATVDLRYRVPFARFTGA